MSASDRNAEPCDLGDYLFPVTLQDAATVALQAIIQAPNLQLIHAQLARGIAVLNHR
ncbi:hypothetical protein [Pseudomonas protegens]|uniref:hypothetical protein n=1 Tax=Pseudomonas protegens TaxID=380021 RepID=UPI003EB93B85